jgi:hypothetical protein
VAGAAIWFIAIQVWAVEELCPYCAAAHSCGLVVGLTVAARLTRRPAAPTPLAPALSGAGVLALLIAGQLLVPPRPAPGTAADEAAHRFGGFAAGHGPATSPSKHVLLGGALQLDEAEFPLLGDPAVPHRMAVLADYTCPECRATHAVLARAHRRLGGRFAVLLLPVPLEAGCNPHVRVTQSRHRGACDLARLALAVWRAEPSRFGDMDAWLFAPPAPPSVADARRHAVTLVGEDPLRRAEADPWVGEAVRRAVAIHNAHGGDRLPKLLLPSTLIVGGVEDEPQLLRILEGEFSLKPP